MKIKTWRVRYVLSLYVTADNEERAKQLCDDSLSHALVCELDDETTNYCPEAEYSDTLFMEEDEI